MNSYDHLPLPVFQGDIQRQTRGGGGGFKYPEGRDKGTFHRNTISAADSIAASLETLKNKFSGSINPSLIYEVEINQRNVSPDIFEKTLAAMGIHILSVAENKKGYWIVFSDDEKFYGFKKKLETYVSEHGAKYEFFHAIESLRDIPREEKIGKDLTERPLGDFPEFIDIELWRMTDPQRNINFVNQMRQRYTGNLNFRITDELISKSFVLLRAKMSREVFDEIIELKEIARADRPSIPPFNPFEFRSIDVKEQDIEPPDDSAAGILIIDSGLISSHPLLEKCIGDEQNFQTGEAAIQDTVGHGTAVAGCAAYGDIESCIQQKLFQASNWIFSAKVMYGERNDFDNSISAVYDPEKLVEHQFKDAVDSFLSNPEYHIRVVNISLGNSQEVWHKHYRRQLPLAALIDELAYAYPAVTFIVAAGNWDPRNEYNSIGDIVDNYPAFLVNNDNFKIINPATAALAMTVGSIAHTTRQQASRFGAEQIKIPIAGQNQPSPFSRTGPGINGMIKPELVEYGGNMILFDNVGRISEDIGGKIALLNNQTTTDLIKFDYGTSFSTPKIAHVAGMIANKYPQKSANFINNMLLIGADYPFIPSKEFYGSKDNAHVIMDHTPVCGYGLPDYERAINSFDNRVVLFDEGQIRLNNVKVYSLQLPEIFFYESGRKKIIIALTFTPETRSTRGDSYLGNRMEFHLFHSVNPQIIVEKYGVISEDAEREGVPEELKKFEIAFTPGANIRKAGCHQKAWKEYKQEPRSRPATPLSLIVLNFNKWINDTSRMQDYCISVVFEHEKEIELYAQLRASIQARARVR